MPIKKPSQQWKEVALSTPPRSRATRQQMCLGVLRQAREQQQDNGLLLIRFEIQDFMLFEVKGRAENLSIVELPAQGDRSVLWFCVQFFGKLTFPSGGTTQPETVGCFSHVGESPSMTATAEKIWALFLGVSGASRQQLLSEYPQLRAHHNPEKRSVAPYLPITYVERQILEGFSKKTFGLFSTPHHIGLLVTNLYAAYTQQLNKHAAAEDSLAGLYHQALAYVQEHYMEADLNRTTIADALHCSTRKLSRAFEDRSRSLSSTILLLRLHRGRELLRERPDLTVEHIAGLLHFFDAQHFARHYKKYFHRSPREDRKNISDWG